MTLASCLDELVSVRRRLNLAKQIVVEEGLYIITHITMEIKLLGISLLDQNILVDPVGSVSERVDSFRQEIKGTLLIALIVLTCRIECPD
jgi:hypothetical protein